MAKTKRAGEALVAPRRSMASPWVRGCAMCDRDHDGKVDRQLYTLPYSTGTFEVVVVRARLIAFREKRWCEPHYRFEVMRGTADTVPGAVLMANIAELDRAHEALERLAERVRRFRVIEGGLSGSGSAEAGTSRFGAS